MRLGGRRDRDRGNTVPEAIGERHYWDAVGRLWSELVVGPSRARELADSTLDDVIPAMGCA